MSHPIAGLADADLTAALAANLRAFWSIYGRAPGSTLFVHPDVTWFYTGVPVALFNGVLTPHLSRQGIETILADVQAQLDAGHVPALWWLEPDADARECDDALIRHGLEPAGEAPGMAIDLGGLDGSLAERSDATVTAVTTPELRALWARLAGLGTGFSEAAVDALIRLETSLSDIEYQAQRRYIGYWQGTPVAVSAMVVDATVAGIFAVATLPKARRKGLGRLMTVAPLLEARRAGCRVGVLQASPMGYPVYQALGFVEVVRYRLYLQTPR